ncbi:MAG: hypothetical protein C5B52_09575 [Bacteroidetes bacterium]|nr:MAG: hypothetical protein C5B52_09575 [Bacteroidota bacterium]
MIAAQFDLKREYQNVRNKYVLTFLLFVFAIISTNGGSFNIKVSYCITFYFFLSLMYSLGKKIPLKEITLFVSSLQLLLAPTLDYEYLGKYTSFHMQIEESNYFAYILPAFIAFWIGMVIPMGKRKYTEKQLIEYLKANPSSNKHLGVIFILLGIIFTFVSVYIETQSLAFIFTLMSLLKYVGILYLWFSDSKYKKFFFWLVFLLVFYQTLNEAIFINFIVISFLFFCYYCLLRHVNVAKAIIITVLAAALLFFLQGVKKDYRKAVWFNQIDQNKFLFLVNLISDKATTLTDKQFLTTAAEVNQRLNQGWVISRIMITIPQKRPYLGGDIFYDEVLGIIFPRLFFTDKAVVQSSEKFEKFAGYKLKKYTIAVGIPGDGYGNFGPVYGVIFCFCVALFFNFALSLFYRGCDRYPILILWSPVIFFYLMRAGDDFYIIANWIVKSSIFVVVFFFLNRKNNKKIEPNSIS